MSTETHVVHLHFHMHNFVINRDFLFSRQNPIADGAWHAVAWDYHSVFLVAGPLLEGLKGKASVEHAGGREEHHGGVSFQTRLVVLADMGEIKHVFFDEGLLNFFVGPVDEKLVVEVCFLGQASREVNRILQPCPIPIRLQKDAQFLGTPERKNWDQHFSAFFQSGVHLFEELTFSRPLTVSNRGGIRRFSQHYIRP